jgi:hypothetical protein
MADLPYINRRSFLRAVPVIAAAGALGTCVPPDAAFALTPEQGARLAHWQDLCRQQDLQWEACRGREGEEYQRWKALYAEQQEAQRLLLHSLWPVETVKAVVAALLEVA